MTSTSFYVTVDAADVVLIPPPIEKSNGGGSMSWFILILLLPFAMNLAYFSME